MKFYSLPLWILGNQVKPLTSEANLWYFWFKYWLHRDYLCPGRKLAAPSDPNNVCIIPLKEIFEILLHVMWSMSKSMSWTKSKSMSWSKSKSMTWSKSHRYFQSDDQYFNSLRAPSTISRDQPEGEQEELIQEHHCSDISRWGSQFWQCKDLFLNLLS